MASPRFQRRKQDRPAEITEAAMAAFAENGFAATKVADVARRAGVSKGLLYLYFKTKEDLFKAVVRSFISPKIDTLARTVESSEHSAEEFLRGPFLQFAKGVPKSHVRFLVRLLVSERSAPIHGQSFPLASGRNVSSSTVLPTPLSPVRIMFSRMVS